MFARRALTLFLVFTFLLPVTAFSGRLSESEELDKVIKKINERQSRNLKMFEKKTKAYFFETQKPETIGSLLKEFSPGDAVTIIVISNLSKKPYKDIVTMRKSGKGWQAIAEQLGVKLKNVLKDVKDFRSGIG
ncbi:MAG: hypothetical protein QMD07_01985 [Thermodesulfovibrionales bacterium]|nr:hypothetical protein [Thermodesulfovibrionales bacterium]